MNETRDHLLEPLLVPARVSLRAEKGGTLVVIEAVNGEALLVKKEADLGANQTRGSGHEKDFTIHAELELFPIGV
jgi:hypothetical protein